jgi:adenylate kinase family enzyme
MTRRIHVVGASGSGTTTLGRALGSRLGIKHFDTDDYFWIKTTAVPYTVKRDVQERVELLRTDLVNESEWVLSGSVCDWGDFAIPLFNLVVFLWIPAELRMKRLLKREVARYGTEALSPGGWFHQHHLEFMAYAASYDSGGIDIRSRLLHDTWLAKLTCPVLRIEEALSLEVLVDRVSAALNAEGELNK